MTPTLLALLALAATERPNILFVFTDDHAAHAISAYGSKINTTPNIDRLAKEGMLFRNCFCTNSICAPSRAVILTGKHSHINGVIDNRQAFDGKQQHLGKLFTAAGYQTALIGKWHLKSDPTGFSHWAVLSGAGGQGTYYNPAFKTDAGPMTKEGYCTDVVTDLALDWLRKRDEKKPFLLLYQHKAPHRNWQPGPEELGLYRDRDIPEPATLFDGHAGLASPARKQEMTIERHLTPHDLKLVPQGGLTKEQAARFEAAYREENEAFAKAKLTGKDLVRWKYQRYIKDYLRCVAGVDRNLGRVLKHLDDSGLAKNTIVVYSSDQGFFLGGRGWYDKRWMYDESLRMPLIVRWPGVVKAGSENRDLVQNLDFAQTLLDAAGIAAPKEMQGASLVPLLKGESPKGWRKSIYYHYFEYPAEHSVARHYGVRTATHKLIHYYLTDEWELFDLVKDPGERVNVYGSRPYLAHQEALKAELARLRKLYKVDEYREELPAKKPDPAEVKMALAWRYTFADGEKRPGKLVKAKAEKGELILEGDGHAALGRPKADPSGKPLSVGALVWLDGANGVIVAQGGESHGYSLYVEKNEPVFAVRSAGKLAVARSGKKLARGRWHHVLGVLDAGGKMRVYIDGKAEGAQVQGGLIEESPADGLSIGADTGSWVGEYRSDNPLTGRLKDVRLYWGMPDEKEAAKWRGAE
jgi:arylsulfatase A-like enzyme